MNLASRFIRAGAELGQRVAQELHERAARLRNSRTRLGDARRAGDRAFTSDPSEICRLAERMLSDNLLAFWARHAPDREHGGFVSHLDRTGRWFATDKYLVLQARLIWTMAAAHRRGLRDAGYLDLARHGVEFLVSRMWDARDGGFVWTVRRDGQPIDSRKLLYGQAFAIYALAEYAIAASDPFALRLAEITLDVIRQHASDGAGFRERFNREWTPVSAASARRKTTNAHLHMLEAMSTLVEVSPRDSHKATLRQLLDIVLTRAVDPRHGGLLEDFDTDWRSAASWRRPVTVSYGHGVEAAWLALRALDVLGEDREPWRARILGLIDHALMYGFDPEHGGLARYGPRAGHVRAAVYLGRDRLVKQWWEQAEMLVAALKVHLWTGNAKYHIAFEKQWDWIWRHQIDHECGEWFASTSWRDGRPLQFHKGDDWKCSYHAARSLMEVVSGLSRTSSPAENPALIR